ncbi:MAG: TldD/PmbA family protein [Acidobacteria bacterium]|nr:TldD/PmbA family protein [Acidobacteriota bacterium]
MLNEKEARESIDRILSFSKADESVVVLTGEETGHARFARNTVTTSGTKQNVQAAVTSSFGKRSGTATVNEFDRASMETVVRRTEEIARLRPENPEFMPALEPQKYTSVQAYFDSTAQAGPEYRARAVADSIRPTSEKGLVTAGFIENGGGFVAIGNTKGLFGYHPHTGVEFNLTVRTQDGTGSGWASRSYNRIESLDPARVASIALDKALLSQKPRALDPGKYPVVLEAPAVADLLAYMAFFMNARSADEGRSFFAVRGGGNKIGQKVVDGRVTIHSDPQLAEAPGRPFDSEGLPTRRLPWLERGVLRNLVYPRYWAAKQGKEPTPFPPNLLMEGGKDRLEDLIASTDRGLLVTRFWYIRMLDPQTLLLTGLTRDGVFFIEKGKVAYPVKNFRWNESPIAVLNAIEALTPAERIVSGEGFGGTDTPVVVPALKARAFTFSSISDAI